MTEAHLAADCDTRHSSGASLTDGSQKTPSAPRRDGSGIPPRIRQVIDLTAAKSGLTAADILGKSRQRRIAYARQETCFRLRELRPQPTLPMIGRWLGLDHTSVLFGARAHAGRGAYDPAAAIYQTGQS